MSLFKVDVQSKEPGFFVVSVFGTLDSETYEQFEEKILSLIGLESKVMLLDLKGLSYISSMGVGSLIKIKKAIEENHGKLLLINLQSQIRKVFDIIKALPSEAIFKNIEEADEYLAKIQKGEIGKR